MRSATTTSPAKTVSQPSTSTLRWGLVHTSAHTVPLARQPWQTPRATTRRIEVGRLITKISMRVGRYIMKSASSKTGGTPCNTKAQRMYASSAPGNAAVKQNRSRLCLVVRRIGSECPKIFMQCRFDLRNKSCRRPKEGAIAPRWRHRWLCACSHAVLWSYSLRVVPLLQLAREVDDVKADSNRSYRISQRRVLAIVCMRWQGWSGRLRPNALIAKAMVRHTHTHTHEKPRPWDGRPKLGHHVEAPRPTLATSSALIPMRQRMNPGWVLDVWWGGTAIRSSSTLEQGYRCGNHCGKPERPNKAEGRRGTSNTSAVFAFALATNGVAPQGHASCKPVAQRATARNNGCAISPKVRKCQAGRPQ